MWLTKIISDNTFSKNDAALSEVVSSSPTKIATAGTVERFSLKTVAPYGIAYVPVIGASSVVMPTENGDVVLGVLSQEKELQPGELMLYSSGGASIVLKNDGSVLINGREVT